MKRYVRVFLIWLFLIAYGNLAFAENRAVHISIGSDGSGDVGPVTANVRQILGHAVGSGVVDKFIVLFPVEGGPIPIEGGLTACAEAGFGMINYTHLNLFKQLRSIKPEAGVFLEIVLIESCDFE